jgi:hypothetical protein
MTKSRMLRVNSMIGMGMMGRKNNSSLPFSHRASQLFPHAVSGSMSVAVAEGGAGAPSAGAAHDHRQTASQMALAVKRMRIVGRSSRAR